MPHRYEDMTVAQESEGAKTWNRPMLEAERSGKARKGALAALESALEDK